MMIIVRLFAVFFLLTISVNARAEMMEPSSISMRFEEGYDELIVFAGHDMEFTDAVKEGINNLLNLTDYQNDFCNKQMFDEMIISLENKVLNIEQSENEIENLLLFEETLDEDQEEKWGKIKSVFKHFVKRREDRKSKPVGVGPIEPRTDAEKRYYLRMSGQMSVTNQYKPNDTDKTASAPRLTINKKMLLKQKEAK